MYLYDKADLGSILVSIFDVMILILKLVCVRVQRAAVSSGWLGGQDISVVYILHEVSQDGQATWKSRDRDFV